MYGYRKIYTDLKEAGKNYGVNRVHRLMNLAGIRSQTGYCKPRHRGGNQRIVVSNKLNRQFNPARPDETWVTDITHIRTHEGWLYLAMVVDLFSRKVIGWSINRVSRKK